jgi:hypothetical protein
MQKARTREGDKWKPIIKNIDLSLKKNTQAPHHEYTELLLSSISEMDPDWLDNLLAKRKSALTV